LQGASLDLTDNSSDSSSDNDVELLSAMPRAKPGEPRNDAIGGGDDVIDDDDEEEEEEQGTFDMLRNKFAEAKRKMMRWRSDKTALAQGPDGVATQRTGRHERKAKGRLARTELLSHPNTGRRGSGFNFDATPGDAELAAYADLDAVRLASDQFSVFRFGRFGLHHVVTSICNHCGVAAMTRVARMTTATRTTTTTWGWLARQPC
jgi:hypothetical protein